MNTSLSSITWRRVGRVIFSLFGIIAALYFFWTTSHLVLGFQAQKRAHVFPTHVSATGWDHPTNALTQELSYLAPVGAFSTQNSASIQLAATVSPPVVPAALPPPVPTPSIPPIVPEVSSSSTTDASTTPAASTPPVPLIPLPPVVLTPPAPVDTASTSSQATSSEPLPDQSASTSTTGALMPVSELQAAALLLSSVSDGAATGTPAQLPLPVMDSSSTDATSTATTTSMLGHARPLATSIATDVARFILSNIFTTVYAKTTTTTVATTSSFASTTSTPVMTDQMPGAITSASDTPSVDDVPDVPDCTVLAVECHTMEFSGFSVDGSLTNKPFKGVALNLSFAALATDGAHSGMLSVRYFHNGGWHSAGSINIDTALSNATNGGYFSEPLSGLSSWGDLSDVKVVIEYVPGDGTQAVSVYVDAIWLDAIYTDQIQDVLSGNVANPTDVPDNVSFSLATGENPQNTLILFDGSKISFPYLDTLNDSLMVRSDRSKYTSIGSGTTTVVYTSITNTGTSADSFQLYTSLPGGTGTVSDVSQYMQNVPNASSTTQTGVVTYYCDAGWAPQISAAGQATSSAPYSCATTGETYACASISDTGANCSVPDVAISTATSTTYVSAWVPMDLTAKPQKDTVVANNLPPGYKPVAVTTKFIQILPGQTLYFRVTLQTPDPQDKRFVLSAKGGAYFGDLDSLRLQTDSYLTAQAKTRKAVIRDNINDQLSEQSDFGVDQMPSFQFKFKTQRNFFVQVANWLLGRTDPYVVQSAHLQHASGENEHLPVDIQYGADNTWTLQLGRQARDFRPGKYTVDLTMGEAGSTYSDSVPFYWGVLALNPDKSSYEPNSTAHLSIAALDDNGDTMCNAQLALTVTDPSGNSSDVPIVSGGGCGTNNVTTLPDFVADYQVGGEGTYTLTLSRLDDTGAIVTSISDSLVVQSAAPYVITRNGPTRIYPKSAYTMQIGVMATSGFTGKIVETVPEGFTIADAGGATLSRGQGVIYLTWDVSLTSADVKTFSYTFKAPDVSPYMYLVGPATLNDSTGVVFTEPRTWKIASDAVAIATGVAWLAGNQLTSGSNLNVPAPTAITWNLSNDYDTTYYSYSTTTNPSWLTINVAGDYLVAVDVPTERADNNTTSTELQCEVDVNGGKRNVGVGRSLGKARYFYDSSCHVYVLLRGLSVGQHIEASVYNLTTDTTDAIAIGTQASMYVEYIGNDQTAYFGLATTTTSLSNPGNLNPTSTSTLTWYDDPTYGRSDSGYSHSNASTPDTISLTSAGSYMVFVNIPDDATTTNVSPLGVVQLGGVPVAGGYFRQGYIDNTSGANDASLQWSGVVVATTSNDALSVGVIADAAAGTSTVLNDQASIFIQKLPSSSIYYVTATTTAGGTNWAPAAASNVLWTTDKIRDTSIFGHSTTTNSYNVVAGPAGDYLLALNDSHYAATTRFNEITAVWVGGVAQTGAETRSHYIRNNGGHNNSSGSLVYLLRNLAASSTITVTTIADPKSGASTVNEDNPAVLMLWHKSAQNSFIQNTEWWYQNGNIQTPTSTWPGAAQGDAITTGNAVLSGTALRIRMGLTANVTTVAGADSFKLQYAPGSVCGLALAWTDVGASGSGSIWRAYHNSVPTAGSTLTTLLLTTSSTTETYEESNPSAVTPNPVTAGKDGEWDWSIQDNGAPTGTNYCFRMIESSGQVLKDFNDYPQLITNATPDVPTLTAPFDNAKIASTSPWLIFSSSDDNNDDINYEIQVSTDPSFATTVIDEDSITNYLKFVDTVNTADKAPFASGQPVEYIPTVTLASSTTYWWRVRAVDTNGSNTYSSYSAPQSFTTDTTVSLTTWYQTTWAQFSEGTLFQTATTSNDSVTLQGANTTGAFYSPEIDYSDVVVGNEWGSVSWRDNHATSTNILYHVEYLTSTSSWAIIPDAALPGNAAGTTTTPFNISGLDSGTYSAIRIRANYTLTTGTPTLYDWTVTWGLGNVQPTLFSPFDNEKISSTTPTFKFMTTNPYGKNLRYQIQWTTDHSFATGLTTRTSGTDAGFADISSTTESDPFSSGDTMSFTIQSADKLASSTTFWWRVRATDPSGSNLYSLWSDPESFTTDTTVNQSTWFQTTTDQFNEDAFTRTGASGDNVTATTTTGNVAIYRASTAGEVLTKSVFNNAWDTTVRADSVYSLPASTTVSLLKGHYAVFYNAEFSSLATVNRVEVQSDLNLGGTSLAAGWSQGIARGSTGAFEAFTAGGAIINVPADGTSLILQSFRTDSNTSTTTVRVPATSGIELIKLDDSWSYIRLSRQTKQTGPVSLKSWIKVAYDRIDENTGSAFSFSSGGNAITLVNPGHYLVFANTYGAITTNVETGVTQALYLDKMLIPGSLTSVYMRGNANSDGDFQGAVATGMIIQSTTTNQVLTVQLIRNIGTAAWTIDGNSTGGYVNRTGLTIVKLPEADFLQLQETAHDNINPAALTAISWNKPNEIDSTSFATSTGNPTRVVANLAGDYLLLGALYAQPGAVATTEFNAGWRKNGGTFNTYGQTGGYNSTAVGGVGNWAGVIFPGVISTDYFEMMTQALGSTTTAIPATTTGLAVEGLRIGSLSEADTNAKTLVSPDIIFTNGSGPKWSTFSWSSSTPGTTVLSMQVLYYHVASSTYDLVPDADLPGNALGFSTTSSISIANLNRITYNDLKVKATFTCAAGSCPTLNDWTVKWSQGITISGIAKAFDQTTNLTSGTVYVAVNGVLQTGKQGTISAGTWSIPYVTAFAGDVITVYINGATGANRAVAITKYTTSGNITGMALYQGHLVLGSNDNPTITDADIGQYDNSVSGNTAIFYDNDSSNNLNVCATTFCYNTRLLILMGTTFEPQASGGVTVTTPNIQIDGAFLPDGNTINVSHSWKDDAVFTAGASTVNFTATSTSETIDSSAATTSTAFYNVNFGTSGTATWSLSNTFNASGTVAINFGTLSPGSSFVNLGGDFSIGASGVFTKGTATTSFTGSGTHTWTDSTAGQDLGNVGVSGVTETINLGSNVKATNLTIASGNTLDVTTNNYGISVGGNWTNNGTFTARSGTVTMTAITTGFTISPGPSSFYNLTFNGVGGNWSFSSVTATTTNNFTITNGTVNLATGTTTVGGSFDGSGGTFVHNNGTVLMNGSGAATVHAGTPSFYNLTFNGSGSWTLLDTNATTSRNMTINAGTVTLPSGTLAVGGSFSNTGGSFTHNSGTLRFTAVSAQTIKLNGSNAYNITFAGSGGSWSFLDTNATSSNNVSFIAGTATLPSGSLGVGGSFTNSGGAFTNNSGTVNFSATATGNTINPGTSTFYNIIFSSSSGGWTIAGNATSTNNATIAAASVWTLSPNINLAVGGTFTNSVGGTATTFATSTLYLYSGSNYTIDTKSAGGDTYGTLIAGASTNIRMWNSSAATTTTASAASVYSMNHAGVSGALRIWGSYTRSSGSDYWDYATDFDGTALGGGSRQVNVQIASSSSITYSGGLLDIVGSASATTTIANQGAGAYTFALSGGTLNASYYQIRNTDANGLNLSGAPTISSLANGDFQLAASGTMMTVASTVINANPALQIYTDRFATSTGVSAGANVIETGVPTSYWWFRQHYGNYAGEAYDNDPGGNPGYIRWDDSGFNLTISGHVYSDHGTTPIGSPTCDGSTPNVKVVINGGSSFQGSCNAGTGAYSISGVSFIGDVTMTTYLNTNGGARAVTVTKTPTANVSNLDLYQNSLIVREEGLTAASISDLAAFDSSKDSDVFFSASTSTNTMVVQPNNELYVAPGMTFTPAGDMTLRSGGSGDARDGRLYLATNSTFTAAGSPSYSIGGGFIADAGATFAPANSTVTFTATTTGKIINAVSPLSLYTLIFNGSGGQWSLNSPSLMTANTLAMTAGTLIGTGSTTVSSGGITGSGTITMTGGTFTVAGTGNFGGANPWQFSNLTFGSGAAASSTDVAGATTTVAGVLTLSSGYTLNAGTTPWVLSGNGTPFVISGTFNVDAAPFWYTSNAATTITTTSYANLTLAPSAAGSPTYTFQSGILNVNNLTIGDGTHTVTANATTNDPTSAIGGSVLINTNATYIASNIGTMNIGGSWTNNGTFTNGGSGVAVNFNSTNTGNTVAPGASSFSDLTFNSSSGGWTITGNATSTGITSITAANNFTLSPNTNLAVLGVFTNGVGGSATTFATSTVYLDSGTSYTINTKSTGADTYGTLIVGPSTNIRMWGSSAATTTMSSSGSLYSMNHAGVSGALNIWGTYTRSSGSDYWDYATDFDGTALGGGSRQVNVQIASSSSLTFSGGLLDIIGIASASTTIGNQGVGAYALAVSGGTLNAQYYQVRNTDQNGLNISGTPTISSLDNGDFQLAASGTMMTVAGSAIDANPLAVFKHDRFATSTGVMGGSNVTEVGSPASYWKFNLGYGNFYGESYDIDPGGDPGYIHWDDSFGLITISGNVYSDEGATVSSVCDNSTQNVKLEVEGATAYTAFCNSSTGAYSIPNVAYNPGDTLTVYLIGSSGKRGVDITMAPAGNVSGMDIYENRVILRHQGATPIAISNIGASYDSHNDSNIPFTVTIGSPNTLVLAPNTKLIIWAGKTFAPGGNVTIQSSGVGGAAAYDGTLEVQTGATFSASGTQSHSIGGNLIFDTGALFNSANSTITFTATTTGKSIAAGSQNFYNVVFNGVGGNWAFASSTAAVNNDFTITNGTVTLATGTTTVAGSFSNTGGTFMHNNGTLLLTSTASGKSIQTNGSSFYNLTVNGSGGSWSFVDSTATTSGDFLLSNGTVTLPTGTFIVGGSFTNNGAFVSNVDTVKFTAAAAGKSITAGGSKFYNLLFSGTGGAWTITDTNATTTRDFTITAGTTTLPSGTMWVGGSFTNSGGFNHSNGTVTFFATTTGKSIAPGISSFFNVNLNSAAGGWTITGNATTTNNMSITAATSFTQGSGTSLAVMGTFTNGVGGAPTIWTGSTLFLDSGTSYSIDTKALGSDIYGTITVGPSTNIRMWNSSASSVFTSSSGSLYSMNHGGASGALDIWGAYSRSSGSDYWDYATDFDGTALAGSSRQVTVQIATSSSVTYSGGLLDIVGTAAATTTIANQGSGTYSFAVSGGTLNANYYQIRNTDANGLNLSGSPSITSLNNGDFQLGINGGTMISVTSAVIDANPSLTASVDRFATSTGITSGYNVSFTGSTINAWIFAGEYGNYAGEAFDNDGATLCGNIQWDDSTCLYVTQSHYEWRNDDGGEGALASQWYNASWTERKQIVASNPNATTYTNYPLRMTIAYTAAMKSDFSDLRFTDSSGTTSIPFFVESVNPSVAATVWVKIPTLPSSGSATVYMYYGNAGASSASSGATTFPFYEDFETNTLSAYSGTALDKSYFTTGTSFVHNGTYGLYASAGNTGAKTSSGGIYRTASLLSTGETLQYYQYVDASVQDEPCTLFGVQASSQNFGVCLEEYPSMHVALVKNVIFNDTSGTVLSSNSVTYTTGWYQVVIDWLTSNLINVRVYKSDGSLFTSLSATDATYSAGGMGFSFWAQNGGWDFYTARQYTAIAPTYLIGTEQGDNGATWKAAQDTPLSGTNGASIGSNIRLRFNITNTGPGRFDELFRLQQAPLGAALNCESVPSGNYNDVPTATAGCGSAPICLATSAQFSNNDPTSPSLTFPSWMAFSAGSILQDPGNAGASQTASTSLAKNTATEVEYNAQFTSNATGNAYCLRTTNGGLDLDFYTHVAEAVILHAPSISNISLNGGQNIVLTEGATTTVIASSTVTDLNGFADIISATSTIYRSGVAGGTSCTATSSNCYQIPASQCTFTNCAGTSCTLTCSASFQYFADPTDASSSYPSQTWLATMAVQDTTGLRDTETVGGSGVELQTLTALEISTPSINFGTFFPGSSSTSSATTTIVNTGNSPINIQVYGSDLTSGSNSIGVGQQKYATSTFQYATCSLCQLLTGSIITAPTVQVEIPQPNSTSTPSTNNIYWGLNVPNPSGAGSYTGTNTFIAVPG